MPSKYERLTVPAEHGYQADGLMAIERLGRLEDAIDRLKAEYDKTLDALDRLKENETTAVYRELLANKAALQELFIRLGIY